MAFWWSYKHIQTYEYIDIFFFIVYFFKKIFKYILQIISHNSSYRLFENKYIIYFYLYTINNYIKIIYKIENWI